MVVTPVFVGEQSACVSLNERGEAVTPLVVVVREMELFYQIHEIKSAQAVDWPVVSPALLAYRQPHSLCSKATSIHGESENSLSRKPT
jgi:hypothetical protein